MNDWMKSALEYRDIDKAALNAALLQLKTCPTCRVLLTPIAFCADVWGCQSCRETWHIPKEPQS